MNSSDGAIWTIEPLDGENRYRLTNLSDHSAWQVVVRDLDGDSVEIPGHISYRHGSFEVTLRPGRYQLIWQITPAMLPPRDDAAHVAAEERSAPFDVPPDGTAPLGIAGTA